MQIWISLAHSFSLDYSLEAAIRAALNVYLTNWSLDLLDMKSDRFRNARFFPHLPGKGQYIHMVPLKCIWYRAMKYSLYYRLHVILTLSALHSQIMSVLVRIRDRKRSFCHNLRAEYIFITALIVYFSAVFLGTTPLFSSSVIEVFTLEYFCKLLICVEFVIWILLG